MQRVEDHRLTPHIGPLPGTGREESPLPEIGAERQRLSVRRLRLGREPGPKGAAEPCHIEVEAAGGNARGDVHDRGVLVAVFGVPPPRLEIDLIHDLGIEQLVQAARDTGGYGYAIHVVRVLRMLPADMDLARWGASRAHDGLLQELGCRTIGSPMVIVLFEDLVSRARVDGERDCRSDLDRGEVDR